MKLNVQGTLHDLPTASVCNQYNAHIFSKLWSDNSYSLFSMANLPINLQFNVNQGFLL